VVVDLDAGVAVDGGRGFSNSNHDSYHFTVVTVIIVQDAGIIVVMEVVVAFVAGAAVEVGVASRW